jgi:hypothetical protein
MPLIADMPRICRGCGCTDNNCIECIERTGEPCHWIGPNLCSACEDIPDAPIHDYFALSYARYLVVPRSVLQSMPARWQADLVELLTQMEERCETGGIKLPPYSVRPPPPSTASPAEFLMYEWLKEYDRGRRNVFIEGPVRIG